MLNKFSKQTPAAKKYLKKKSTTQIHHEPHSLKLNCPELPKNPVLSTTSHGKFNPNGQRQDTSNFYCSDGLQGQSNSSAQDPDSVRMFSCFVSWYSDIRQQITEQEPSK